MTPSGPPHVGFSVNRPQSAHAPRINHPDRNNDNAVAAPGSSGSRTRPPPHTSSTHRLHQQRLPPSEEGDDDDSVVIHEGGDDGDSLNYSVGSASESPVQSVGMLLQYRSFDVVIIVDETTKTQCMTHG